MATLHLFRGWPGSGKTSAASRMFPGLAKFENDMYFEKDGKYQWTRFGLPSAIKWCNECIKKCLDLGMDCVVSNTFTKKSYIETYKKIADEHGAKFKVYRCIGEYKNVHGLPPSIVESFKSRMEDWPGETIVNPDNKASCG